MVEKQKIEPELPCPQCGSKMEIVGTIEGTKDFAVCPNPKCHYSEEYC